MNHYIKSYRFLAKLSTIFRRGKVQLITPTERKKLLELKAETDRIYGEVLRFGVDRPAEIRREALAKCEADPTPENIAALEAVNTNQKEVARHCQTIRSTLNYALKRFCKEKVVPVVLPILERALTAAEKEHDELEAREQKSAEEYGVPFEPSETLNAVKASAQKLRMQIDAIKNQEHAQQACLPCAALSLDPGN